MKVDCRSSGGMDRCGVVNGRGCQRVLVRGIIDFSDTKDSRVR